MPLGSHMSMSGSECGTSAATPGTNSPGTALPSALRTTSFATTSLGCMRVTISTPLFVSEFLAASHLYQFPRSNDVAVRSGVYWPHESKMKEARILRARQQEEEKRKTNWAGVLNPAQLLEARSIAAP
jgi:hypothetical protein